MGLRFRRRVRLFGGFFVNLGRRGASLTWHPLRWLTFSKRGTTISAPGTGLSVQVPTKEEEDKR